MQLIVDDLAITYERRGKGRLLLLLHGWGDDHHTFKLLAKQLSANYEVLILDLPGFGTSQAPSEVWNLDNYTEFLSSFLKKLQLKPYAIIGHSNGGALAIRGLAENVLTANKLILLASAGIRSTQKAKRLATKVVAKTGKATTFWLPSQTRQQLRRKLYGTVGSDMLVAPHLEETFKLTVHQDLQADATKLNLPTLIINADDDPAIPLRDGELFAKLIKGSKLKVLNSSSHFIHQDQTDQILKLIKEFL